METILYNGKAYLKRAFLVELADVGEREITISTESLATALGDYEKFGSEEEDIDNDIYFYVADVHLDLPAKIICGEHLDVKIKFIEEL